MVMEINLRNVSTAALAYYSIRSKQNYIYRTNKIKEIVGASRAITNAFDYFLNCNKIETSLGDDSLFELSKVIEEFSSTLGKDGFVLFKGGGNLLVLFKNREICLKHNRCFSKNLLQKYYSMTPLCCMVDVDLNKNDYSTDYDRLMKEATRIKQTEMPIEPINAMPFVMLDRNTFQPITHRQSMAGEMTELSAEALGKLNSYKEIKNTTGITQLDDLVTKKGEESLLAVVYIDGNNMGAKIGRLLDGKKTYDECVNALRNNSDKIETHYIIEGEKAVQTKLAEKYEGKHMWRRIVGGGDEITFICNARYALQLTRAYLDRITDSGNSSCAGIAVFHSHFPFSTAYRIAEEACENAKNKTRNLRNKQGYEGIEVSAIDFQFIHSGVDSDLESIREEQNGKKMGRPYIYKANLGENDASQEAAKESGLLLISKLDKLQKEFSEARSCIKEMGAAVSESPTSAMMSFKRIASQYKGMESNIKNNVTGDSDTLFKLFYDFAEFYDLWFDGEMTESLKKEDLQNEVHA